MLLSIKTGVVLSKTWRRSFDLRIYNFGNRVMGKVLFSNESSQNWPPFYRRMRESSPTVPSKRFLSSQQSNIERRTGPYEHDVLFWSLVLLNIETCNLSIRTHHMKRRTPSYQHIQWWSNTFQELLDRSPVNHVALKTVSFQAVPNRKMERDPNRANVQEKEKRKPPFPSNPASITFQTPETYERD